MITCCEQTPISWYGLCILSACVSESSGTSACSLFELREVLRRHKEQLVPHSCLSVEGGCLWIPLSSWAHVLYYTCHLPATRIKTRCPSMIHTWLLSNGRLFMPVPSPMLAKHFSYLLACVLSSCVSFSSFFKLQAVAGLAGVIPICICSEWHELRCQSPKPHQAFLTVPWVCLNLHLEKVFCKYFGAVTELHCTNLASLLCVARGANFLWNNLCIVLCK